MPLRRLFPAFALALSALAAHAQPVPVETQAQLAAAARATPLAGIDTRPAACTGSRSLEQWLTELAGEKTPVRWAAGPCRLIGPEAGDVGGNWCAQAVLLPPRRRDRADAPVVELHFDPQADGRPGPGHTFRGVINTANGRAFTRSPGEFEAAWLARFPGSVPAACGAGQAAAPAK